MNQLLMLLLALAQQQQQRARQGQGGGEPRPGAGQRAGGGNPMDPSSGSRYSPQGYGALQWLNQNYWDPGRMGQSTQPGGGNVWEGFTRGSNPDPRRNPYGGNIGAMRGGMPNPRESASESLARNVGGQNMNSFQGWLGDFFQSQAQPYKEGSNWPLGIPKGAHGPGYDADYQKDWQDFFGRGHSLEAMDSALRGEYGGGGGGFGGSIFLR